MIVFISDTFNKKINFVAFYQIVGGAIGVLLTFWVLLNLQSGGFLFLLGTMGLYSYSMYCGKLLIDGKIKEGLRHSTINQVTQVINFAIAGYAFKFISGINLTIGIDYTTELHFFYNYSLSQFQINLNSHKELVTVGLNLVALSMIFLIGNLMIEHQADINKTKIIPEDKIV